MRLVQGGGEIWDIHAIPLAGGPAVNLTNTPDVAESEARLTGGQLIALARRAKTGSSVDIVLLDRRTGTVRALTREADATRVWVPVGWSPDGRSLFANRGLITQSEGAIYYLKGPTAP